MSKLWPCLKLGDPRLPRLVFLHGFLGRGADWEPVAATLAGRYHCILPDLPGHGANTHLPLEIPLSYESVAQGLQTTLADGDRRPVILAGYSLGGRIALYASLRFPDFVRALVLESTSPGIADPAARQERVRADERRAEDIASFGMRAFIDDWYRQPLFRSFQHRPALLEQIRQSRQDNDPTWMAKVIRELSPGCQPFLGDRLSELNIPTLLLAGSLDEKYAVALREMVIRIPRARGLVLPRAGHTIHAERPVRFSQILAAFLSCCVES